LLRLRFVHAARLSHHLLFRCPRRQAVGKTFNRRLVTFSVTRMSRRGPGARRTVTRALFDE
jgi:hypothetical protein